jgi:hypothetical protein
MRRSSKLIVVNHEPGVRIKRYVAMERTSELMRRYWATWSVFRAPANLTDL